MVTLLAGLEECSSIVLRILYLFLLFNPVFVRSISNDLSFGYQRIQCSQNLQPLTSTILSFNPNMFSVEGAVGREPVE